MPRPCTAPKVYGPAGIPWDIRMATDKLRWRLVCRPHACTNAHAATQKHVTNLKIGVVFYHAISVYMYLRLDATHPAAEYAIPWLRGPLWVTMWVPFRGRRRIVFMTYSPYYFE